MESNVQLYSIHNIYFVNFFKKMLKIIKNVNLKPLNGLFFTNYSTFAISVFSEIPLLLKASI